MAEWFDHITTLTCTCDGITFHNDHHEFGLEIPKGAIPKEESINIDIGVALYGPFKYPNGLRPVSPIFWICTQDSGFSKFKKPVTVTIPHCVSLERANSLGLTFLKGKHEVNSHKVYQFQEVEEESEMVFEAHHTRATLRATHFCSLCIASKISPELVKSTNFCICAAIPPVVTPNQISNCCFFVSFMLGTCIETVKRQIAEEEEFKQHITLKEAFKFSNEQDDLVLEIVLPDSPSGEYTAGLQGSKTLSYFHVMIWCLLSFPPNRFI